MNRCLRDPTLKEHKYADNACGRAASHRYFEGRSPKLFASLSFRLMNERY